VSSLIKQFSQSSHIAGGNAAFVEELYETWLADPAAVSAEWRSYFDGLKGREAGDVPHSLVMADIMRAAREAGRGVIVAADTDSQKQAAVLKMVTRSRGHLGANLDPLGMAAKQAAPGSRPALPRAVEGRPRHRVQHRHAVAGPQRMKLRDLLARLKATYCGSIGAEFMHITEAEQRRWMYERLEAAGGDFGSRRRQAPRARS
jgi:2-oxoglutarate dehydrogenase E1 component